MLKHVVQVFITVLKVDKRLHDLKAPFWSDGQVKNLQFGGFKLTFPHPHFNKCLKA